MRHTAALAPFLFLIAIGFFVVLVMVLSSGCAYPARPAVSHPHAKVDDLGQAMIDSQNYHAKRNR